jgi:hypothetical protein
MQSARALGAILNEESGNDIRVINRLQSCSSPTSRGARASRGKETGRSPDCQVPIGLLAFGSKRVNLPKASSPVLHANGSICARMPTTTAPTIHSSRLLKSLMRTLTRYPLLRAPLCLHANVFIASLQRNRAPQHHRHLNLIRIWLATAASGVVGIAVSSTETRRRGLAHLPLQVNLRGLRPVRHSWPTFVSKQTRLCPKVPRYLFG